MLFRSQQNGRVFAWCQTYIVSLTDPFERPVVPSKNSIVDAKVIGAFSLLDFFRIVGWLSERRRPLRRKCWLLAAVYTTKTALRFAMHPWIFSIDFTTVLPSWTQISNTLFHFLPSLLSLLLSSFCSINYQNLLSFLGFLFIHRCKSSVQSSLTKESFKLITFEK